MSEAAIVGYCRACGTALDENTVRNAMGAIYCAEHIPLEHPVAGSPAQNAMAPGPIATGSIATPPPFGTPPPIPPSQPFQRTPPKHEAQTGTHGSPALAFLLGWIPGVGAVYNGQYAKGLVHVLILGSIISILSNDAAHGFEPLLGLMIAAFFFYMAFEAYHTAKKREMGQPVDEFSSLFPVRNSSPRFPMVAALLIVFGVLFLLSNLDLLELHRVLRYWPAALIVLGLYMLYERFTEEKAPEGHE